MAAWVVLNEDDQPNVFIPNFDNEKKLAQKELESEYVCANNCCSQFPEDEMHSIQLQMAGLEEPEHCMHTGPHPASNIVKLLILNVFCTRVGFKKCNLAMISYFNKHSLPGKC